MPKKRKTDECSPLRKIRRVVVEQVRPEVDAGRFPIKRINGDFVAVQADVFADGHDALQVILLHRPQSQAEWSETEMRALGNDVWQGEFQVTSLEKYFYTVQARTDPFGSWSHDIAKKMEAAQDVTVDLLVGIGLIEQAAARAAGADVRLLEQVTAALNKLRSIDVAGAVQRATAPELREVMRRNVDRSRDVRYSRELAVTVDRERARFSAWYEMFPRSCADQPRRHGTFRDCIARLEYVASMGFDVLYFPPIHPIGQSHRKGKNNAPACEPADVGSPWAIGSLEGGHKAIHPQLGTLQDFKELIDQAKQMGLEIAMDLAFQCAPDHPYPREHQEWFRLRPDGTVQYAENPPKKYEDIVPLDFENDHSAELCDELKSVVFYWIEQGVRIFRVDNPHTKPFAFWEWLIADVKNQWPEVIFLSEAFTRPKVMARLCKLGFTQTYTYFAWRNTKQELTDYFTELTQAGVREYMRPNLWPNTPDILTEYLQVGGRPAFMIRLLLAATLGASYGIYGPAFELCENRALKAGTEDYLDSEKFQVRHWELDRADSLRELIARINQIRRDNPALHSDWNLRFHPVDNDFLIAYSKVTPDLSNVVLTVVNLDPHHTQSGWVDLPLETLGLDPQLPFQAHDMVSGARYLWNGPRNYVELNPFAVPGHVFRIRRKIHTERDFDYYL